MLADCLEEKSLEEEGEAEEGEAKEGEVKVPLIDLLFVQPHRSIQSTIYPYRINRSSLIVRCKLCNRVFDDDVYKLGLSKEVCSESSKLLCCLLILDIYSLNSKVFFYFNIN